MYLSERHVYRNYVDKERYGRRGERNMLHENLLTLRKLHHYSQEKVAEEIGVSRQALAKWETGETTPDISNCMALAKLYEVSLDDLVQFSQEERGIPVPPKGKHLFGAVTVGEKGQIVIPKKAREIFGIMPGDKLLVLGDEAQGIAIVKAEVMMNFMREVKNVMPGKGESGEEM